MKLARKLIASIVAAFLVVLGVLGYWEAKRALRDHHAAVAAELAITGRSLRAPLSEVLDVEGEARAVALVKRADTDSASMDIRWVSLETDPLDASLAATLLRGDEATVLDHSEPSGRLSVYVPVPSRKAALEVSRSLAEDRAVVLGIVRDRALTGVLALLVGALLMIVGGVKMVGEPMKELTEHARRIGAGDLSRRIPVRGRDEIGELASEMNAMCDRLLEAHVRLAAEAEAKLKATEQLRHADRLGTIGTLASGMAHELGTPLGIIGGRAKMIASGKVAPAEIVSYANVISEQVGRMTKIMRGLLDFARRTPPAKSSVDLREIAERTCELLAPLAKQRSVVLERTSDGAPSTVDADRTQVEQALANLIVNAVQSIEGGGTVSVELDRERTKAPGEEEAREYVRLGVRDDGRGIAKEQLARIFEPFFTTKDVGEGTGLGLAVTYGIVREHGGFVDVESEVGQGSRFSLFFPVRGDR